MSEPRNDFDRRLTVRPLRLDDYEQLVEVELRCFPGMKPWHKDQIASQLEHFPEGQICVEMDGRIVASSSSLVVKFDEDKAWHDWAAIADGGYIRTHDPNGDTLYGIEIMVDPEFRGMRLARRLYSARKNLAREMNLERIIIGGRIPGYHKHADKLTAEQYVEQVTSKALIDRVLTAQLSNGFTLQRLIPNYLPSDKESLGYATFLEWKNFDHRAADRRSLRAVDIVRVAAVQYEIREVKAFEQFARQCEYFVDAGTESQCDFLVFPELITTQLLSMTPPQRPGLAARSLHEFTDRYVELFSRLAIKYDVNIVGGSQFVIDDAKLYNVAHLFHRNGRVSRQRQLHVPPQDRRWWGVSAGDSLDVFDTDRGRVAVLSAYDVQFPEVARAAAKRGAEILLVPFNVPDEDAYLRVRYCAAARTVENHVYVVLAGCTGNLPFVPNADTHYAISAILTPCDITFSRDGIAALSVANVEGVHVSDLDLELLRRHRYTGTTQNWNDRRPELYELRFKDGRDDGAI